MITSNTVQTLIAVGRTDDVDSPTVAALLAELELCERHSYLFDWNKWKSLMQPMSTPDVAALARGLAVAEARIHQWYGGSVSPVICIWRELECRDPALAKSVAIWVIQHNTNPYVPFCSMRGRDDFARQLATEEARRRNALLESQILAHRDGLEWERQKHGWFERELSGLQERKRQQAEERERQERERLALKAVKIKRRENHRLTTIQRAIERRRLIKGAEGLTELERLRIVASRNEFPLLFFPSDWATVADETLCAMTPHERASLIARVQERRTEPWKRLHERLVNASPL
jgi:hypothetical protein